MSGWAYLGLGANLGHPQSTLAGAVQALSKLGEVLACSALYETDPWPLDAVAQPAYLNAAVLLRTPRPLRGDEPRQLLAALLQIEAGFGRERTAGARNTPRLLDLDVLLLGEDGQDQVHLSGEPALVVPHPRLHLRAFALRPLLDLHPGLWHPSLQRSLISIYEEVSQSQVPRLLTTRLLPASGTTTTPPS